MSGKRPKHSELSPEQRRKANTRSYSNQLQRRGVLVPQPCERCGSPDAQKHHDDYGDPRTVRWLCRPCHLKEHPHHGGGGRPSKRRMELSPVMVRLSPDERAAFQAKADRAGLNRSDAARAAIEAWQPEVPSGG
jgi:hypothetical protein